MVVPFLFYPWKNNKDNKTPWEGQTAEETHYLMYKDLLEREYGEGNGIVWDNTWHGFLYLSAKKFPKMKI